jgi:hypothetical protein
VCRIISRVFETDAKTKKQKKTIEALYMCINEEEIALTSGSPGELDCGVRILVYEGKNLHSI